VSGATGKGSGGSEGRRDDSGKVVSLFPTGREDLVPFAAAAGRPEDRESAGDLPDNDGHGTGPWSSDFEPSSRLVDNRFEIRRARLAELKRLRREEIREAREARAQAAASARGAHRAPPRLRIPVPTRRGTATRAAAAVLIIGAVAALLAGGSVGGPGRQGHQRVLGAALVPDLSGIAHLRARAPAEPRRGQHRRRRAQTVRAGRARRILRVALAPAPAAPVASSPVSVSSAPARAPSPRAQASSPAAIATSSAPAPPAVPPTTPVSRASAPPRATTSATGQEFSFER
jgi:hypothetical protein